MKMRDKFSVSDGNILCLSLIPEMMQKKVYRNQLRKLTIDYLFNKMEKKK